MIGVTLRLIGRSTLGLLGDAGALWRLALSATTGFFAAPFLGEPIRWRGTVVQAVRAGWDSLPLAGLISLLAGMIIALQSAYQLEKLGAVHLVPDLVALSVTRELAPLLTAIIVAGRFGSAIAAELATMKISREIDALVVMGIDPLNLLVVPRLVGLLITLPCLTVFADVIGVVGGLGVATGVVGQGARAYMAETIDALVLQDIFIGLVKAAIFGGIIGLVGCHQGLQTRGGAEEVGRSTTAAVVRSVVLIVGADLFVTALFYLRG